MKSSIGLKGLLFCVGTLLLSFSTKKGGDSFEIFVNGKMVVQHFVAITSDIPNLALTQKDRIDVYYSHCGKPGTNRVISVRNEKNEIVKQWKYADSDNKSPMPCDLKEIPGFTVKGNHFNLCYTSKELPSGRLLAVLKG